MGNTKTRRGTAFGGLSAVVLLLLLLLLVPAGFFSPSVAQGQGQGPVIVSPVTIGEHPCLPRGMIITDGIPATAKYLRGEVPTDPADAGPVDAAKMAPYLQKYSSWFEYSGDGSAKAVGDWLSGVVVVQISEPLTVLNSYCPNGGPMTEWKVMTFQPGEPIGFLTDGKGEPRFDRPVLRALCGNLLVPAPPGVAPGEAPPVTAPPGTPSVPGAPGGGHGGPPPTGPPHTGPPPTTRPGKCANQGEFCGTQLSGPEQQPLQDNDPAKVAPTPGYHRGNAEAVDKVQKEAQKAPTYQPTPKGREAPGGAPAGQSDGPSGTKTGTSGGTSHPAPTEGSGQTSSGDPGAP